VIRTKIDLLQSSKKELESWSDFAEPYINISSVSGSGIPQLVKAIVETINES
jgi:predicted GTPase